MDGLLGTFASVLFWSAFFVVFVFGFFLLLVKVVSNREWKVEYNGNVIRVENTWVRETLYINAAVLLQIIFNPTTSHKLTQIAA